MAIDIGPVTWVTFVSDVGTPANMTQYAGIRLLWPQATPLPQLGKRDVLVVLGLSIPGYSRVGSNGIEWVMQAALDPIVVALDSIPGTDGWASASSRTTFSNLGTSLLAQGIGLADAKLALTQLYQASVANFIAAHPQ